MPRDPVAARVDSLDHDGRGVARVADKVVFIDGALPGEEVMFSYLNRRSRYDEGRVVEVLSPSPERVEPRCAHAGTCGGCSLQHLGAEAQIRHKQAQLLAALGHATGAPPATILAPLTGPLWGYRRKARLGARYVVKKGRLLVGFREKRSGFVADLARCEVLDPRVGQRLEALRDTLAGLSVVRAIPQVEVAVGDDRVVLVLRHLEPPSSEDRELLGRFAMTHGCQILLQPGGRDSVVDLDGRAPEPLLYRLEAHGLTLEFQPLDFTQVNTVINAAMVDRALELLAPRPDHAVLDLFCGLGNFTLPLARRVSRVLGVEGDAALVDQARHNAQRNGIDNAEFVVADLTDLERPPPWYDQGFERLLLDPPRSGALAVVSRLPRPVPPLIVYVSCNPATLARDAGVLVREQGYRLAAAGVMDMFPHTSHVESMAVFERGRVI
ncbi:MAG: 23S rRNA (uracil(1939)-C(5))-methyltransferase RlmD [Gammaproteobacteria bacterium]|nr:23S rRNA (uracil(1939)-C(5))-methyltransferase RlmD [Gammaproteobacteria bacterium]